MSRTIKHLILAAGFAAASLTVTVAPAHADGPGDIQIGPIVDPEPQPEPQPVPEGPGEVVNPPKCTHGCGGDEDAPQDVINNGPLEADEPDQGCFEGCDLPEEDPANDAPVDQGCFEGCDLPEEPVDEAAEEPAAEAVPAQLDLDAKFGADSDVVAGDFAPAVTEEGDLDLLWILGGAAGLGALALLAVARRRRQQEDVA